MRRVRPISRAARGPPPAGMLDVDQGDVGLFPGGHRGCLVRVGGGSHERQARFLGQQLRQCVAQGRLVVGHQHANEYVGVRPGKEGAHDP